MRAAAIPLLLRMRVVAVALRVVLPAASRRRRRRSRPERLLLVAIPCKHAWHLVALDGPSESPVNSKRTMKQQSVPVVPLHRRCMRAATAAALAAPAFLVAATRVRVMVVRRSLAPLTPRLGVAWRSL